MVVDMTEMPTFEDLINPTLRALHRLGGSGAIQEIVDDAYYLHN